MAGIVNVPKFVDFRNKVKRHSWKKFPVLSLSGKSTIAIHHSLTKQGLGGSNAESYARYHCDSLGWPSIGYSYVIEPDGTIKFCNDIELRTYHVGNHNNYAVGICLTGDFRTEKPTKEQEQSLCNLVNALQKKYTHLKYVKGHSEFSGYEWKQCPVFDFRKVLKGGTSTYTPPNKQTESSTVSTSASGRVESKVNGLRFYNKPSWSDKDVVGRVNKGIGFPTIVKKLKVGKGYQYQVKNSKGATYYITASSKYVKVEGSAPKVSKPSKPSKKYPLPNGVYSRARHGGKSLNAVKQIQRASNAAYFKVGKVDGYFGGKTEDAIRRFQSVYLPYEVDGVYGKNTCKELDKKVN